MPDTSLRIIFAGTPDFAAMHLKALIDSKHQLIAVYTQPDRPAGRGKKLLPSPVKTVAEKAGLPLYQPQSLKGEAEQAELAALGADLMIVVAYGLILPQPVLDAPRLGCINVHASLLPRWRGAAPIQRAIEAGDSETGITIMQMDAGLDTGDMLATCTTPITDATTAATLHDELAAAGPPLLIQVLDDIDNFRAGAQVQDDDGATYAHKLAKAEALIDWTGDAVELGQRVRAFNPFPVCFTQLDGERIRIWQAQVSAIDAGVPPGTVTAADDTGITVACGSGQLVIQSLQLPGGKQLSAQQVLNARREQFAPGTRFDPAPTGDS